MINYEMPSFEVKCLLKKTHRLCYSIIYCKSRLFRSSSFKVIEDRPFLLWLISHKSIAELDASEKFYTEILAQQLSVKCIMSRTVSLSLNATVDDVPLVDESQFITFEEIKKVKRGKTKVPKVLTADLIISALAERETV